MKEYKIYKEYEKIGDSIVPVYTVNYKGFFRLFEEGYVFSDKKQAEKCLNLLNKGEYIRQ